MTSPAPGASDPAPLPAAFCAPGLAGYAARLLEGKNEKVSEVIEHPYMTGRTDILLVAPPPCNTYKIIEERLRDAQGGAGQ